ARIRPGDNAQRCHDLLCVHRPHHQQQGNGPKSPNTGDRFHSLRFHHGSTSVVSIVSQTSTIPPGLIRSSGPGVGNWRATLANAVSLPLLPQPFTSTTSPRFNEAKVSTAFISSKPMPRTSGTCTRSPFWPCPSTKVTDSPLRI